VSSGDPLTYFVIPIRHLKNLNPRLTISYRGEQKCGWDEIMPVIVLTR
jgi:hypothetical protein